MTAPTIVRVGHPDGGTVTFEWRGEWMLIIERTAPVSDSPTLRVRVERASYLLRRARLRPYLQARKARRVGHA
jgi:hypothetical protein